MSARVCSIEGCGQPHVARGWCKKHWAHWRRHGRPTVLTAAERVMERVSQNGDCWEWTGTISPSGYGRVWFQGTRRPAHRLSYETFRGPIPDGLDIDHLCRNRKCVNPDHLEPVTRRENSLRGASPAISLYHAGVCKNGHQREPGQRCAICRAERRRERRALGEAS